MLKSFVETASAIGGRQVNKGPRLLLMMIAVHCKPNGEWRGSHADMARWTGYDVRSIPTLLQKLEAAKVIEFDTPRHGANTPASPHHTVVKLLFAKASSRRSKASGFPPAKTQKASPPLPAPELRPTTWQQPKRVRRRRDPGPKTGDLFPVEPASSKGS